MLPTVSLLPLVLFIVLVLAVALGALAASGHFPREHRGVAFTSSSGAAILFGSILLLFLSLAAGLTVAWRLIPWFAAVIGGGLAVLVAPLMLQLFSDRFVDGRAAPLSFTALAVALAAALLWVADF